jgi:hypothetical protein
MICSYKSGPILQLSRLATFHSTQAMLGDRQCLPHLPFIHGIPPHTLPENIHKGAGRGPLTCGAGAEPVGRLQVLDASRVLTGYVDSGGWRCWRVQPRFTGGLRV